MASTVTNRSVQGTCPDCERPLYEYDVVIEYEVGDGGRAAWAECPGCREVVHPAA
jgi:hypothetical protein